MQSEAHAACFAAPSIPQAANGDLIQQTGPLCGSTDAEALYDKVVNGGDAGTSQVIGAPGNPRGLNLQGTSALPVRKQDQSDEHC